MRHMLRPFRPGTSILDQACPMGEIFETLTAQLAELQHFRAQQAGFITEDA